MMSLSSVKNAAIFVAKVAAAVALINHIAARSAAIRAIVQPAPR